jgi:hypothetical protein
MHGRLAILRSGRFLRLRMRGERNMDGFRLKFNRFSTAYFLECNVDGCPRKFEMHQMSVAMVHQSQHDMIGIPQTESLFESSTVTDSDNGN